MSLKRTELMPFGAPQQDGAAPRRVTPETSPKETRGWTKPRRNPGSSLIGRTVGSYRVTRLLGEGGVGAVYLGEHPLVGALVAIKVLHDDFADCPTMVERFIQEARAANQIASPHIVRVSDFGRFSDGRYYAVMEYLEGEPLDSVLTAEGHLLPARAADICRQVALGMSAAHAAGVLHRDLKPENMFLEKRPDDGHDFVRILDFGIAKLLESSEERSDAPGMTMPGNVLGTPIYCSPEQARGQPVTLQTDIYALGAVAYELLAGVPVFEGNCVEILIAKTTRDVAPIQSKRPGLPDEIAELVMQMLSRSPAQRPASMADVARRFESFAETHMLATAVPEGLARMSHTLVSGPVARTDVVVPRTSLASGATPDPLMASPSGSSGTPMALATSRSSRWSVATPRSKVGWAAVLSLATGALALTWMGVPRGGDAGSAPPSPTADSVIAPSAEPRATTPQVPAPHESSPAASSSNVAQPSPAPSASSRLSKPEGSSNRGRAR